MAKVLSVKTYLRFTPAKYVLLFTRYCLLWLRYKGEAKQILFDRENSIAFGYIPYTIVLLFVLWRKLFIYKTNNMK